MCKPTHRFGKIHALAPRKRRNPAWAGLLACGVLAVIVCSCERKEERAKNVDISGLTGEHEGEVGGGKGQRGGAAAGSEGQIATLRNVAMLGNLDDRKVVAGLWRELAAHDPVGALNLITEMHPVFLSTLLADDADVLRELARDHYAEVDKWLHERAPTSNHVLSFRYELITEMARVAPAHAVALLDGMSEQEVSANLRPALWALATRNPDEALKLAKQRLAGVELGSALKGIVGSVAQTDPARAFAIAKSFEPEHANASLPGVFWYWFSTDASSAVKSLEGLQPAVITAILSDGHNVKLLAEADSGLLIQALGNIPWVASTGKIYSSAALVLARSRPEEIPALVAGLPDSKRRNELVVELFAAACEKNAKQAQALIASLPENLQDGALRGIVKKLAVMDYPAATDLAQSHAGPIGDELYREIGRSMIAVSPLGAVKMIEDPAVTARIGGDFRLEMINRTVETWAVRNLPAAQQWVEKLPATDAPKGVQGLMTTWMRSDPIAASQWLSAQPTGPARDAGARVVIDQIKDTDPEMAERWRKALPQEK